ncbi:hypothetical protein, partial [Herbiconiux daphne]
VGNVGTDIAHGVTHAAEAIGHGIQKGLQGIGHAFQSPSVGTGDAVQAAQNDDTSAAAPNVAVPKAETGNEETTASKKKATARAGKKSLTVARSAGTGVNV